MRLQTILALALTCSLAEAQTWQQLAPPLRRTRSAIAFDPVRQTVMLYGGQHYREGIWSSVVGLHDTWEFDGSTWVHQPDQTPPPADVSHRMASDTARGRVVLFGGYVFSTQAFVPGTFEWDGGTWRQLPIASPPPRYNHCLAFDSRRNVVVLYGGQGPAGGFADTWEFDGTTWVQRTAQVGAPTPSIRGGMAYDGARGCMVLYGLDGTTSIPVPQTWEYSGAFATYWTLVATGAPSARFDPAMAYDSARQRVVLYGGTESRFGTRLTDTWAFTGSGWTQAATNAPSHAWGAGIACDPVHARIVMVDEERATWELVGSTWTQLPQPALPTARDGHTLAYDPRQQRTVLFGGCDTADRDDTWQHDDSGWTLLNPSLRPSARHAHAMVYDAAGDRLLLFGGMSGAFFDGDTWALRDSTWTHLATSTSPPARSHHAMAHDARRQQVVLFGGIGANGGLQDTWVFDGQDWSPRNVTGPSARNGHAMVYDAQRDRVLLHGGLGGTMRVLGDTWSFDGSGWQLLPVPATPRTGHALAFDPSRGVCLAFGGHDGTDFTDQLLQFDGATWSVVPQGVPPLPRYASALAAAGDRGTALLFGGSQIYLAYNNQFLDIARYADTWQLLPPDQPSWASLGASCSSSGAPLSLTATSGAPALGTQMQLQLAGLPPTPGAVFLLFGLSIERWQGAALPVTLAGAGAASCQLWMAPAPGAYVLRLHGGGSLNFSVSIPNAMALDGMLVGAQALALDASTANGVWGLSNAGVMRLH